MKNKKTIFVAMVSGLVVLVPAHASDKSTKVANTLISGGSKVLQAGSKASRLDTLKTLSLQAAADEVESGLKGAVSPYVDYLESSVRAGDSLSGSAFELMALKAYDSKGQADGFLFNQFSLNHFDHRTTANLGLGYRHFLNDRKWMLGANIFYDHEFPNNHQRLGGGLEIKSTIFKAAYNNYEGLSGFKSDRSNVDSKALDGHDIRANLTLPYLPGASLGFEQFKWKGEDGADDLKGHKWSVNGKLSQYVAVDAGRTYYDGNARDDDNWFKLTFKLDLGPTHKEPTILDVAKEAYSLLDIDSERYKPVQRENRIVKQKKFAATVTGI